MRNFEDCVRFVGIEMEEDGKADVAEIVEDGRIVRHRLKIGVKPLHDFFERRPRSAIALTNGKGAWWVKGALASLGHAAIVVDGAQEAIARALERDPKARPSEALACLLRDEPDALVEVEPTSPAAQIENAVTALCEDLQGTIRAKLAEAGVTVPAGGASELVAAWPALEMPDALRAEHQRTIDSIAELAASADVLDERLRALRFPERPGA